MEHVLQLQLGKPCVPDDDTLGNSFAFDVRFACLQEWFIRASWFDKLRFLASLLRETVSKVVIWRLLRYIGNGRLKDITYVSNQDSVQCEYDIIPLDDNRSMDVDTLFCVMKKDCIWFSSLNHKKQLDVLLGLLRLGGCALTGKVIEESCKIIQANRHIHSILGGLPAVDTNDTEALSDTSLKETGADNHQKVKATGENVNQNFADRSPTGSQIETSRKLSNSMKAGVKPSLEIALQQQKNAWAEKLAALCQQYGVENRWQPEDAAIKGKKKSSRLIKSAGSNTKGRKTKKAPGEMLDQIQLLPLWASRGIVKKLNNEALNNAKKVNRYWSTMVDDVRKENSLRTKIDKDIAKFEQLLGKARPPVLGSRVQEGQRRGSASTEDSGCSGRKFSFMEPLGPQALQPLLSAYSFTSYKDMFSGRHTIYRISQKFLHCRVMACGPRGRLMAVTTHQRTVVFYCLLTASLLTPRLSGHSGVITCMCFHPDGTHVFTGSYDTTVRCWDIWTNHTTKIYLGHSKTITSVSAIDDYVASGSRDKQVKVFHVWSGQCITTIHDDHFVTDVKLVPGRNNVYFGCHCGEITVYDFLSKDPLAQVTGHQGDVTSLFLSGPLLASSGIDGFVRLWNIHNLGPNCLMSLPHGNPVRCVSIFHLLVVSGCEAGRLRVWDARTGDLLRLIRVTPETRPILQLHCFEEEDHAKIVVSAETGVKVFGFSTADGATAHPSAPMGIQIPHHSASCTQNNMMNNPSDEHAISNHTNSIKLGVECSRGCMKLPVVDTEPPAYIPPRVVRLQELSTRCCTLPALRSVPCGTMGTDCVLLSAAYEGPAIDSTAAKVLKCFPRMIPPDPSSYQIPLKLPPVEWNKQGEPEVHSRGRQFSTSKLSSVLVKTQHPNTNSSTKQVYPK